MAAKSQAKSAGARLFTEIKPGDIFSGMKWNVKTHNCSQAAVDTLIRDFQTADLTAGNFTI